MTPPAIVAGCDEGPVQCTGGCPALQRWTSGLYSDLEQVVISDTAAHAQCEAKLKACQACLRRLQAKGVIQ